MWEYYHKLPLDRCIDRYWRHFILTKINSTSIEEKRFSSNDCSGEESERRVLTNECESFGSGSDILYIPLTADDLIPDVNCNCDFDEFLDFDYVAAVDTGATSNKNETADGDTAKDETADGEAAHTSGSQHII